MDASIDFIVDWILEVLIARYIELLDTEYPNIRQTPELISLLVKDKTTNRNIRWATDSHIELGKAFQPEKPVRLNHLTNGKESLIQPRASKALAEQKNRTKASAEVFTPTWVVKKQNDLIEEEFKDLDLEEYIGKTWLEITCGEAPYMCSRYDMVSGEKVDIKDRIGFVDRKLQRISKEIDDYDEWYRLVVLAYKSSFGYEFQGDSLLIARENMLYTFVDYYVGKFNRIPSIDEMKEIAEIIVWNVFQMDGLKYVVPCTEGIYVKIMDWEMEEEFEFRELLEDDKDE